MKGPKILHQTIVYKTDEPYLIQTATKEGVNHTYIKNSHWHEELEIAYIVSGRSLHYIDGECYEGTPGRMIVTNCESVHRISVDTEADSEPDGVAAVILLISRQFLDEHFPQHRAIRFENRETQVCAEVRSIMQRCLEMHNAERTPYDDLYFRGMLLQLLYHLCQAGVTSHSEFSAVHEENERLKNILRYIDEHYKESLTQADIAARFYFTPQYFSRYFKQHTGTTFLDHLTGKRIHEARKELLRTGKSITEIAYDNGFADVRSFINAFKNMYQLTPMQYRKNALWGLQ